MTSVKLKAHYVLERKGNKAAAVLVRAGFKCNTYFAVMVVKILAHVRHLHGIHENFRIKAVKGYVFSAVAYASGAWLSGAVVYVKMRRGSSGRGGKHIFSAVGDAEALNYVADGQRNDGAVRVNAEARRIVKLLAVNDRAVLRAVGGGHVV